MLWISLALSAGAAFTVFVAESRRAYVPATVWLLVALPLSTMIFSPAFAFFVLGLFLTSLLCSTFGFGRRVLIPGSLCFFLLGFGYASGKAWERIEADRRAYPVASLEARLAGERESPGRAAIDPDLQTVYDKAVYGYSYTDQRDDLRQLHDDAVARFAGSPGFGVMRHMRPELRPVEVESIPLPESLFHAEDYFNPGEAREIRAAHDDGDLLKLNQSTQLEFAHPFDFGFVRARREAAGFVPHNFGGSKSRKHYTFAAPTPDVHRLELVSLLKYDEPQVYVTDQFPRMDLLADAPTRPLDEFERTHLPALFEGAQIRAERSELGTRMLGAIRAVNQCTDCHDARQGELLGAFSYELDARTPE